MKNTFGNLKLKGRGLLHITLSTYVPHFQHLPPHMRYLYPAHPDEDLSPSASPAIVEAVPRDHVVVSEEYRTLSREDQLRASIKLKESSLI